MSIIDELACAAGDPHLFAVPVTDRSRCEHCEHRWDELTAAHASPEDWNYLMPDGVVRSGWGLYWPPREKR